MKWLLVLFALGVAIGGGGSEVADRGGRGSGYDPGTGKPKCERPAPQKEYAVVSVDYSKDELKPGESLEVRVVLEAAPSPLPPTICTGVLRATDLRDTFIRDQDCGVTKIDVRHYALTLAFTFPLKTVSREYVATEINVNGDDVMLKGAPKVRVHGSDSLPLFDLQDLKLRMTTPTGRVRHGELFFVEARVHSASPLTRVILHYLIEQGCGLQEASLELDQDMAGYSQKRDGEYLVLSVPLKSDDKFVRRFELESVHVLNGALQAAEVVPTGGRTVDIE